MKYETNRQKLSDYFYKIIFPQMGNYGIDYNKTISVLTSELQLSRKMVLEFIDSLIQSGKLREYRLLELSEEELKKREEEFLKVEKEAESIIKGELSEEVKK